MKISKIFMAFLFSMTLILMSFNNIPSRIKKKVDKEVKIAFDIQSYDLKQVEISDAIKTKLQIKIKDNSFFKIFSNNQFIGYAFIDKAPSKTDEFDYLVLFDTDLIIKKTKVLVYREDYGGEIGSKRWLKQFIGKNKDSKLVYERDIIAISGATISANSMTIAINNLLKSIELLHKHKAI